MRGSLECSQVVIPIVHATVQVVDSVVEGLCFDGLIKARVGIATLEEACVVIGGVRVDVEDDHLAEGIHSHAVVPICAGGDDTDSGTRLSKHVDEGLGWD